MKIYDRKFNDDYYCNDIGWGKATRGVRRLKARIKKLAHKFYRAVGRRLCRQESVKNE